MFERISRSFSLAKSSFNVLMNDKKLLLFPLFSGLAWIAIMVLIFAPLTWLLAVTNVLGHWEVQAQGGFAETEYKVNPVVAIILVFALYYVSWFVVIFCNSALVSCALMHFNGEKPTLGDGFRAAWARLPQIALWCLVASTVSVLLKLIESGRDNWVGKFISRLLGAAWAVMTFFVVPVLVVEKVGPIQAVKNSIGHLKKTWGEALIGNIGLGLFQFLLFLPAMLLFGIAVACFTQNYIALGFTFLALGVVYTIIFAIFSSALSTVFVTALYQYAAYDRVPLGYEEDVVRHAFVSKPA
jgi:hypothetical protein